MKSQIFKTLRQLLAAMGFRIQTKDILLLENWKDESSNNRSFCMGINKVVMDEVPAKELTPVRRMREFSERSGIKIADET